MFMRFTLSFLTLIVSASAGISETINLRNSCDLWEHIPANETLKSPVAALLQCTDENGSWLSVQIMCIAKTAEIEFRYRPSYPIVAPIPPIEVSEDSSDADVISAEQAIPETENTVPDLKPLGKKEMLFFDFPKLGVTSVVNYDFTAGDWSYREKEPMSALFHNLIVGSFADVSLLAMGVSERLPLRGSSKAIGPVVDACRIAKRKLKQDAALAAQN